MANLDISSRLGKNKQEITIAEGKTYEVDCSAETMLKAEEKFNNGAGANDLFAIIEMFLGKAAVKDIKAMKATVNEIKTIIIAIMAQVNEEDFDSFEKRFQNQLK